MITAKVEEQDRLKILEDANGVRPVVLLIGSGMSADAGIPLSAQLSDYLVQVDLARYNHGLKTLPEFVERNKWPSRHDLRPQLMLRQPCPNARRTTIGQTRQEIVKRALLSEIGRVAPTFAESLRDWVGNIDDRRFNESLDKFQQSNIAYRSLLSSLCEGQQHFIDSCFDHFIRHRVPTTTHQLIVFLSQLLQIRVLLTTNFDPLLERAFRQEDVTPTVFEIGPAGVLPSNQLLLSQEPSIVKLHGGTHQMQTGFELDQPLRSEAREAFRSLFERLREPAQREPLMVVMGYSGSDKRVMDVVETWLRANQNADGECSVLWIDRSAKIPPLLEDIKTRLRMSRPQKHDAVVYSRCRDGRLFLLEAYQRLAGCFPTTRSYYQAVNFVAQISPEEPQLLDDEKERALEPGAVWLIAQDNGSGSSSRLSALATEAENPTALKGSAMPARDRFTVIWIDMADLPGVSALLDVISERLGKIDARLEPLRRPMMLDALLDDMPIGASLGTKVDERTDAEKELEQQELVTATAWLQHALRRDKYFLALDSFDEFPGSHPAVTHSDAFNERRDVERERALELLRRLTGNPWALGDSCVAMAVGADGSFRSGPLEDQPGVTSASTPTNLRLDAEASAAISEWRRWIAKTLGGGKEISEADARKAALTCTVVAARRIREESLLVQCTDRLAKDIAKAQRPDPDYLGEIHAAPDQGLGLGHGIDEQTRKELLALIRDCEGYAPASAPPPAPSSVSTDLPARLIKLDGGYRWIHHVARNAIYRACIEDAPLLMVLAHHRLALFYYDDLFDRSNDPRAFTEFLFHRSAALDLALKSKASCRDGFVQRWLTRSVRAIRRNKSALVARARVPSLVDELIRLLNLPAKWRRVLDSEPESAKYKQVATQLESDLWGLMADVLFAAGYPHSAKLCAAQRLASLIGIEPTGMSALISAVAENLSPSEATEPQHGDVARAASDLLITMRDPVIFSEDDIRTRFGREADKDWVTKFDLYESRSEHQDQCAGLQNSLTAWADRVLAAEDTNTSPPGYPSAIALDLTEREVASAIRKREMDAKLTPSRVRLVDAAQLYRHAADRTAPPAHFGQSVPILTEPKYAAQFPRLGPRRQRHECYRLTLLACDAVWAHDQVDGNARNRIERLFAEAELVLDRQGGPADLQALATTKLLDAGRRIEHYERQFAWWLSGHSEETPKPGMTIPAWMLSWLSAVEVKVFERDLREIRHLMDSAQALLGIGRGENRWRLVLLITLVRMHMLFAILRSNDDVERQDHLRWVGRFLATALTNCGARTDRRLILKEWWNTLEVFFKSAGVGEWNGEVEGLGFSWPRPDQVPPQVTAALGRPLNSHSSREE